MAAAAAAALTGGGRCWPSASRAPAPRLLPGSTRVRKALRTECRARAHGDSGLPRALTLPEAYAVLGLPEGANYDAVLATKNRLLERFQEDAERSSQVEAAYDVIFSNHAGRLASHLELLYNVSQTERSQVEQCQGCRGSGEQECAWCHGTGAMTVGEMLYCSEGGCTPCPVCRGKGLCPCPNCRGTGRRATWLAQGPL